MTSQVLPRQQALSARQGSRIRPVARYALTGAVLFFCYLPVPLHLRTAAELPAAASALWRVLGQPARVYLVDGFTVLTWHGNLMPG